MKSKNDQKFIYTVGQEPNSSIWIICSDLETYINMIIINTVQKSIWNIFCYQTL